MATRKRAASSLSPRPAKVAKCTSTLTTAEYRGRLKDQGKYRDRKPGSSSLDGCLKDPPVLPPEVSVRSKKMSIPKRAADGTFSFPDHPNFKPNLSPQEVMQLGSFGGTYYRDIVSAVTGKAYKGKEVIKEFPTAWFKGLKIEEYVTAPTYAKKCNKYGVACGASLGQWECSGWISPLDPYGWFQWYCRFYLGRRTTDDERQISRWAAGQGPSGRWRSRLCNDIVAKKAKFDDPKVSPVIRQVLQHWAYRITDSDVKRSVKK